jgi:periplasmic divalent cation tolerance protein
MGKGSVVVVMVSAPDVERASSLARDLVEKRLAACVNLVQGIRSFYRWEGEICQDQEVLLWIKTRKELLGSLVQAIRSVHPYELPEILALDVAGGLPEYMAWVQDETS